MWRSQSSIGTTHRPPWTSLLANSKRVFRFAKYVANSATLLACRGQLRVCVSDGLIKSKPEVRGTNRDSRALKDEPWLVKVRTLDDGRTIQVHADRAQMGETARERSDQSQVSHGQI